MFCCFGLFSASYLARCGAQLSTPLSLLLLCRPVPNFMEVLCLNGKSVTVDPAEGLQEAKIQVAKVLGTLPDAVSISCGGQILSELERLNSKAEFDALDAPLFAMVDQERLEVAKHLAKFEEELVVFQRQLVERQEIKETYEEKKRELHMDWCQTFSQLKIDWRRATWPREKRQIWSRALADWTAWMWWGSALDVPSCFEHMDVWCRKLIGEGSACIVHWRSRD